MSVGWSFGRRPFCSALAERLLADVLLLVAAAMAFFTISSAAEVEPPIDPVRGRQLMERWQRGDTLTTDEQAYLARVRQEIQRRAGQRRPGSTPAPRGTSSGTTDWSSLTALTDLAGTYKGETGGLYGGGQNQMPDGHRSAYLAESAKIRPLDAAGRAATEGRIVMLTIGRVS